MAKKVSIEFTLKIPRSRDATFVIAVPTDELLGVRADPDVSQVTEFIKGKLAIGDGSVLQLKVLNGREVVSAWKNAKTAAAKA